MCCEILDGRISIPTSIDDVDMEERSLTDWVKSAPRSLLPIELRKRQSFGKDYLKVKRDCFSRNIRAVSSFQSVYISVLASDAQECFTFCRMLLGLVRGKSVTIEVPGERSKDNFLFSCRLWDCDTFQIVDREYM